MVTSADPFAILVILDTTPYVLCIGIIIYPVAPSVSSNVNVPFPVLPALTSVTSGECAFIFILKICIFPDNFDKFTFCSRNGVGEDDGKNERTREKRRVAMIRAPTGKENIMIRAGPGRVLFYCKLTGG